MFYRMQHKDGDIWGSLDSAWWKKDNDGNFGVFVWFKKHWFVLNLVMWKTKGKATLKHQCVSLTAAAFYHIAT